MLVRARYLARCSALLGLLIYSTGCLDGDTTGPALEVEDGFARFDFFGSGLAGTFDANGGFSRDSRGVVKRQSFATGIDVNRPPYLYFGIIAAEFAQADLNDLNITISDQAKGEYKIMSYQSCADRIEQGTGNCAAISHTFGLTSDGIFVNGTRSFELVDGTLIVTSISDGRLQGTFSGSSRQLTNTISGDQYVADVEVEISNGSFDVPLVTLEEWNGLMQFNPEVGTRLESR